MSKKPIITILLLAALAVAAYFALQKNKQTGSLGQLHNDYSLKDTASISKIYLANKNGEKILLERKGKGNWSLNGKYKANQASVGILLKTINRSRIKSPVPKAMHDNVVKELAGSSIKVEVYTKNPDEPKLSYYIGNPAKDYKGTFAISEKNGEIAAKPYIVEIPGFDGYLTIRYHTREHEWRDRAVFSIQPENIAELKVDYPRTPQNSFIIQRNDDVYSLKPLHSTASTMLESNLSQELITDYLSEYKFKYAEAIDNDHPKRDTMATTTPYAIFTIQLNDGTSSETTMYYMPINERTRMREDAQGNPLSVDAEYYLGFINNNQDFVILQDYVFSPVFKKYKEFYLEVGEQLIQ